MSSELNQKLKQLNIEDFIWVIYLGIIVLSWYSNSLERKYFVNGNRKCKEKYRNIMIIIFSVLVVVYIYFLKGSVDDLKGLKSFDSQKKKRLVYLSFLASLLIAISGFILLYLAYVDENIDVEIAFS